MKRSALISLAALVLLLGGCAQAILPGGPGAAGGPGLTALTVSPSGTTIPGVAQQQYTAKSGDGSKPSVNWLINGIADGNATLGTISASGMYTAPEFPPAPNSITISAVETSNTSRQGNASATLNNPVPQLTSVAPLEVAQGAFTIEQLRAVVVREDRRNVAVVKVAQTVDHLSGRGLDGPDLHVGSVLAKETTHTHQGAGGSETGHEVRDLRYVNQDLGAGVRIVRFGIGGIRVLVEEGPVGIVRAERLRESNGAIRSFGAR